MKKKRKDLNNRSWRRASQPCFIAEDLFATSFSQFPIATCRKLQKRLKLSFHEQRVSPIHDLFFRLQVTYTVRPLFTLV
uniref:Uncharacterized protein n=1 Tax=Glycine max TaxID=3847 RepID=A0A0R0FEF1_SOYBN